MKASEIAAAAGGTLKGEDVSVLFVTHRADKAGTGGLYACLKGSCSDGADFCKEAAERGACAVLTEESTGCGLPEIIVPDARAGYAAAASALNGDPGKGLDFIAVVGTNGKSTTAYLIKEILSRSGVPAGLIGTMYCEFGGKRTAADMTTPDPSDLFRILAGMKQDGAKVVVAEVSAHAIALKKTYGLKASAAVFTNLGRDHLDYFGSIENYRAVKKSYFRPENIRCAIVNGDDPCGREICRSCGVPCVTYGLSDPADVFAIDVESGEEGSSYVANVMDDLVYVHTRLIGVFNVYNALAACTAAKLFGIGAESISRALAEIPPPEGRFETVFKDGVLYVVDFAHTPEGLENLLKEASALCRGRLRAVFGCGGDRDRTKRPIMGAIASRLASDVIITSDNPRTESRADIAEQVKAGADGKASVSVILDRAEAIAAAAASARAGDVVVIAGKGAETYIDENNVKTPYSDILTLKGVLGI